MDATGWWYLCQFRILKLVARFRLLRGFNGGSDDTAGSCSRTNDLQLVLKLACVWVSVTVLVMVLWWQFNLEQTDARKGQAAATIMGKTYPMCPVIRSEVLYISSSKWHRLFTGILLYIPGYAYTISNFNWRVMMASRRRFCTGCKSKYRVNIPGRLTRHWPTQTWAYTKPTDQLQQCGSTQRSRVLSLRTQLAAQGRQCRSDSNRVWLFLPGLWAVEHCHAVPIRRPFTVSRLVGHTLRKAPSNSLISNNVMATWG